MSDIEEWRPIRGYEGYYEVSNLGRVRSLPREIVRTTGAVERRAGRVMKQHTAGKGYLFISLRRHGIKEQRYAHRVVAEAFIPGDTSLHVNHLDCNKTNNRADNLEWATPKANSQHAAANGRVVLPAETTLAIFNPKKAKKLTATAVEDIRLRAAQGETRRSLADRYGLRLCTVRSIVLHEIWDVRVKRAARADAAAQGEGHG